MTSGDTSTSTAELRPVRLPPLPERPTVSVLLTNYNYERFLAQSIQSCLEQSYGDVEIIVCDDGSRDRSLKVARDLERDHQQVTVVAQENAGHFAALNHAFSRSAGEIVCPLDADDYFHPDKAGAIVDVLRSRPDSGAAVHPVVRVDESGNEHGVYPLRGSLDEGWLGPRVLASGGFVQWVQTGMIALRREVAERIFPMDERLVQGPDIFLRGAASLLTPITRINQTLAYYRLHGANQGNSAQRFTRAQTIERHRIQLADFGAVYRALDDWLRRQRPGLALPPFERTRPFIERSYVIARLEGDRVAARSLHRDLRSLGDSMTPALQSFYKVSPLLPRPVFKAGLDLIYGQSRIKAAAGTLLKRR